MALLPHIHGPTAEVRLLGKEQPHDRATFLCAIKNKCKLGNGSKEIEIACKNA